MLHPFLAISYNVRPFLKKGVQNLLFWAVFLGCSFFVFGSMRALAQDYTTGLLKGQVTDSSKQPVSGANIQLTSNTQGFVRSVTTNKNGEFRIPRLPVGRYTFKVTASGYREYIEESLNILVGNDTSILVSLDGAAEDIVKVVGTRQQSRIDFNASSTGLTIDVDELVEDIPIPRTLNNLLLLAPGTSSGDSSFGGVSIGGSSVAENVYYVDGMNTTNFRKSLGSSQPPFEFYKNVEVKSGGYAAEFGRATGGVSNAVTKSGSNKFHYGANLYWEPDGLRNNAPNTPFSRNDLTKDSSAEANFYVSGPLWKDRLFFYALYHPTKFNSKSYGATGTEIDRKGKNRFWGIKLDANITDRHRLSFTGFSNKRNFQPKTYQNDYALQTRQARGYSDDRYGGNTYILKYSGIITNWFNISMLYGRGSTDSIVNPSTKDLPVIYDNRVQPRRELGGFSSSRIIKTKDARKLYRIDADFFFNALGDHKVRLGYDRENLESDTSTLVSGGVQYDYYFTSKTRDNDFGLGRGEQYYRVRHYENTGKFQTVQTAYYIQDDWNITDSITLNLGIRNETFDNKNKLGETFVSTKNQIAPRLGLAYNPEWDPQSKFYMNLGRYYLPIATNTNIRLAGTETFISDYYSYNGMNADSTPIEGRYIRTDTSGDGKPKNPLTLVGQDLKPMYTDEFMVGYERLFDGGFLDGWKFGLNYTHRELGSLIEDIAIDAAIIKWADKNGYDMDAVRGIWTGFKQYVLHNPGKDLNIYTDKLPGKEGELVKLDLSAKDLGYPKGIRKYDAVTFDFNKETKSWLVNGSYTWSRSKGNYEGSVKSDNGQADPGLTEDFDQPGLTDYSYGYLPNHRAHRFKLWASYIFPNGITVGTRYQLTSPRKFGCIGLHPTDSFAAQYGASSWYCGGQPARRGTRLESDWESRMDLTFAYTRPVKFGSMIFRVDIFNVFNSTAAVDLSEEGEDDGGRADINYGKPSSYQTPRYFRLSISFQH